MNARRYQPRVTPALTITLTFRSGYSETFKSVINLKTAKAFGLTIPPARRLRADEGTQ